MLSASDIYFKALDGLCSGSKPKPVEKDPSTTDFATWVIIRAQNLGNKNISKTRTKVWSNLIQPFQQSDVKPKFIWTL